MISCTQGLWLRACHGCSHGLARLGTDCKWLSLAWFGTAWLSMIWHSLAWLSLARHSTARLGTAQLSVAQHGTAQHTSAWHDTARHGSACPGHSPQHGEQHGAACSAVHACASAAPFGGQELADPYPHQPAMGLSPPAPSPSQETQQMLLKVELPSWFQLRFSLDQATRVISTPRLSQTHSLGAQSNPFGQKAAGKILINNCTGDAWRTISR